MISFPIFERITVKGYGLYPGTAERPGLDAEFLPGVTLVIGANGLGKSTLVLMIFRLLTGPTEISGQGLSELGSGQLGFRDLYPYERRTFAQRVHDAGSGAVGEMTFRLGKRRVKVTRRLQDLALIDLVIDDKGIEPTEQEFQRSIQEAGGFSDFLDWHLILRYLVFYFDDRRSLVWDPTAQRRILGLLFSQDNKIEPDNDLVKRILQEDSYVRNLSATIARQEGLLKRQEGAIASAPKLKAEMSDLTERRTVLDAELQKLQSVLPELENARAAARLDSLRAQEEREQALWELESLRINELQRAFPSHSETATYLLSQLLASDECLVCGNEAHATADELRERIDDGRCVLCATSLEGALDDNIGSSDIEGAKERLQRAVEAEDAAQLNRLAMEEEFHQALSRITSLQAELAGVEAGLERLSRQLPESAQSVNKTRSALQELRSQMLTMREQVLAAKEQYAQLVDQKNNLVIAKHREAVKQAFETHAADFLLENCALAWGQHLEKVGQLGNAIRFSVFQIDMTGGDNRTATRREAAGQVSESQREFIDLAFRMALIQVGVTGGSGTLVMDAPESSLDAVFAPRAARVLSRFGSGDGESRVVITSNLVDGRLIPMVVKLSGISGPRDPRVINLFEVATPTAALRELRSEYDDALDRAFHGDGL